MKTSLIIIILLIASCRSHQQDYLLIADTIPARSIHGNVYNISKPIVVENFFLRDFILQADLNNNLSDSAKAFINENRTRYYEIMDFYGYYNTIIRKNLYPFKIPILRLNTSFDVLQFKTTDNQYYNIDLNTYHKRSGLFLFNGKTAPVFWDSNGDVGLNNKTLKAFFSKRNR